MDHFAQWERLDSRPIKESITISYLYLFVPCV